MLPAMVLAAGRSSRFGSPKALAAAGGVTFISKIINTLEAAGVTETIVVGRAEDHELAAEVGSSGHAARVVVNPDPDRGQLSSLITGLDAIDGPGVNGVLVTLVDMPLVSAAAIRQLIDRAAVSAAAVVRAVHAGRHGHPVVFKRAAFDALRRADPSVGAKAVVHAMAVEDVEIEDPGVVEDVDTPADYERLFGVRISGRAMKQPR
jgi:CTP:molybdopterin cytidylyltransferase MocA